MIEPKNNDFYFEPVQQQSKEDQRAFEVRFMKPI